MKTIFHLIKKPPHLLIASILLMTCSNLMAQENKSAQLSDFKIIIHKTDDGIKLKCEKGCTWKELTFSLENNKEPQAIDTNGMSDMNSSGNIDTKLSAFLFTLEKIENGLILKGIEGTAWTELSFWFPKNGIQAINQLGMVKPR